MCKRTPRRTPCGWRDADSHDRRQNKAVLWIPVKYRVQTMNMSLRPSSVLVVQRQTKHDQNSPALRSLSVEKQQSQLTCPLGESGLHDHDGNRVIWSWWVERAWDYNMFNYGWASPCFLLRWRQMCCIQGVTGGTDQTSGGCSLC